MPNKNDRTTSGAGGEGTASTAGAASTTPVAEGSTPPPPPPSSSSGDAYCDPGPDPQQELVEVIRTGFDTLASSPGIASSGRSLRQTELQEFGAGYFYTAIRLHTERISFGAYEAFVHRLLCKEKDDYNLKAILPNNQYQDLRVLAESPSPRLSDGEIFRLLKLATDAFLLVNAGAWRPRRANGFSRIDVPSQAELLAELARGDRNETVDVVGSGTSTRVEVDGRIEPAYGYEHFRTELSRFFASTERNYLDAVIRGFDGSPVATTNGSPFCAGYLAPEGPFLMELLWNYWMEEAMLTQAVNAVSLRFQNVRRPGRDPLADLELDPLRPLSAFLWGYIQDESNRLSIKRRAYEYNHQYGLTLYGRAVPPLRPADPRSRFLEAFHNLLRTAAGFYREDNDTTVVAEAFGVLNALKDVHLLLSEGAHNQFRSLTWQARGEMLMQQWLMSRDEMRDFLRGRPMVAYPEPWMARVDAMKKVQGWNDTSVIHFNDLARFGERLLLSIRYGNWSAITDQEEARTWARYWKPEVQGYIHGYQTVTGVNLAAEETVARRDDRYLPPSYHLRRRLQQGALRARW